MIQKKQDTNVFETPELEAKRNTLGHLRGQVFVFRLPNPTNIVLVCIIQSISTVVYVGWERYINL